MKPLNEMGRWRQRKDYSQERGNPTSELQANYDLLMSIDDPDELAKTAVDIVRPLIGRGFSENNYKRFMFNLKNASEKGLEGIKGFLTNFILAGSGMGVESREKAIASMITESTNDLVELTPHQRALKEMVERYGYHVALISE